eukprot:PhF_6_TR39653/c0_g1_i3/m.58833
MDAYFNQLAVLLRQSTSSLSEAEAWLKILRRGTTPHELNYSHMGINSTVIIAVISSLHELRESLNRINLAGNNLTDVVVGPLVASLRALPRIVLVDLSSNDLTDAGVEHIFRSNPGEIVWRLSNNSKVTQASAMYLAKLNKKLQRAPQEVDRLKERRDEAFREQHLSTHDEAVRERDRLRAILLREDVSGDNSNNNNGTTTSRTNLSASISEAPPATTASTVPSSALKPTTTTPSSNTITSANLAAN